MKQETQNRLSNIPVEKIKLGMYLGDVFDAQGNLLFASGTLIHSAEQIELLKKHNVSSVFAIEIKENPGVYDRARVVDVANLEEAYYKELSRAKEIHQYTIQTARETLINAKLGD